MQGKKKPLPGTEMTLTDGHGLPIWKLKGQ